MNTSLIAMADRAEASATDIQFMLADYHKEVWDAAQSDNPNYDYAGRETGKKIVAAIRALAALPDLSKLATYDPDCDSPGTMELRDKYNDGDYVKLGDVRAIFAGSGK